MGESIVYFIGGFIAVMSFLATAIGMIFFERDLYKLQKRRANNARGSNRIQ